MSWPRFCEVAAYGGFGGEAPDGEAAGVGRDVEVWEIGAPWWLLDVETSGLDRQEDDIIALRLACMEEYQIKQEREILIFPRRPLRAWAEGVTGISNQMLEQALPLEETLQELEALDSPLLFLDRDFTLPFLRNAYSRCDREFSNPCLLLDRLAALLLGCSPRQKTDIFL